MSKLSEYINTHTAFLNVFVPTLKAIVDELPLPAPIKATFDQAYSMAPAVIVSGAALLAELEGGRDQPAAVALAGAFGPESPAPTAADMVAPALPASVHEAPPPPPAGSPPPATPPGMTQAPAPAPALPPMTPAPAPAPTPPAPTPPAPEPAPAGPPPLAQLVPTPTAPAVPTPAPIPPTPLVPTALPQLDQGQLAQLAAAMGLQLMGPGGQVIPPGP